MRLFVALDIEDSIRDKISRFFEDVREFAPEARWVRPESLHVTLKFIGDKPTEVVDQIKSSLSTIQADSFEINIRGYGFFPGTQSPRVFWIGVESDSRLPDLAAKVDEKLSMLEISEIPKSENSRKEEHVFNPHLTLARGAGGSASPRWRKEDRPNRNFRRLQEKLAALPQPEFGKTGAREFFLYESQLSPRGSKYTKLAMFALRESHRR
jgi:RNA 2',3'-cyclic 3'-phosphodiesterase